MANRPAEVVKAEREEGVKLLAKAGIHGVDPGASEQKLWKTGKMKKISAKFPKKIMEAFKTQDKWLIRRCDALIVMTGDTPSDGTWREMAYAEKIEIPVVMIAPRRLRGELVSWSNIEVPYIVNDIKAAIRLIKRKFVRSYNQHHQYFEDAIKNARRASKKNGKHRNRKLSKKHSKRVKRSK